MTEAASRGRSGRETQPVGVAPVDGLLVRLRQGQPFAEGQALLGVLVGVVCPEEDVFHAEGLGGAEEVWREVVAAGGDPNAVLEVLARLSG